MPLNMTMTPSSRYRSFNYGNFKVENQKMTGNNRLLEEYEKRKSSVLRKHEAELEALKVRQKRELEALEMRYTHVLQQEKKSSKVH